MKRESWKTTQHMSRWNSRSPPRARPTHNARRLAASVGISPQAVIVHMHEGFGMKCFHLRLLPYVLADDQKTKRLKQAQAIIEALDNHSRTGFKYLLTVDEL
jgi:hypothetical protein